MTGAAESRPEAADATATGGATDGGGGHQGSAGGGAGGAAGGGGGTAGTSAHTSSAPAHNTRTGGKGRGNKGKKPASRTPEEEWTENVQALMKQGDMLIKVGGGRAGEWEPDPAALRTDDEAVTNLLDEIAAIDFNNTPPTQEELATEAVAITAGLRVVQQMLTARIAAIQTVRTPGGAGTAGGAAGKANRRRTNSISATGRNGGATPTRGGRGSRSNSLSAAGGTTAAGAVQSRLLALAGTPSGGTALAAAAPAPSAASGVAGSSSATTGARGPSSSLHIPSWLTGANRHPYDPNNCTAGDNFYLELPPPWNGIPERKTSNAAEVYKVAVATLPKFDGTPSAYSGWRSCFIPCVHLTNIDVTYKALLLRSSLVPKTARMKEFVEGIRGTGGGYRHAIVTLEDRYGGHDATLLASQDALLAVPELREGEYRTVEMLHSRLSTFLVDWAGATGTDMDETDSLAFFTMVMSRIEPTYSLKYHDWLRRRGSPRGLQSLHDWLGEQLKDHRQVELYQKRRNSAQRAAMRLQQEAAGGGRSNRKQSSFPSSHMDRNYKHSFLTLDQEWEEAEAGELGEEGGEEQVFFSRPNTNKQPLRCPICSTAHSLGSCTKFKEMSPKERKELLVKDGRCFLCFQRSHPVTKCRFKYNCHTCGGKHHTMIHGADENYLPKSAHLLAADEDVDEEGAAELLDFGLLAGAPSGRAAVSLRTITLWVRNPDNGRTTKINALLDDGCTSAGLLSTELAEELKLQGPAHWTSTEGVGGKVTSYRTILSKIQIKGSGGSFVNLGVQIMKRPAGSYSPVDWTTKKGEFPHLADLPVEAPVRDAPVHLLIGSKVPWLSAALQERRAANYAPVARLTPLGWTITGPTSPSMPSDRSAALVALLATAAEATPLAEGEWLQHKGLLQIKNNRPVKVEDDISDRQLHRLVQRMLREEEFSEVLALSPREEYIVRQAKATLTWEGDKYAVGCTWAPQAGRPSLNLPQAERRLRSLETSRHFANPTIKQAYEKVIEGWKEGGEVKVVDFPSAHVRYLLPHFPVVNLEKKTTPVRVVMDCKIELNKYLLSGPNLINEVPAVLLRFRSGLYTYSGDVKKMFLRVSLVPEDRPFHCFLWRKPDGSLEYLQFQVHVFGNAGSPFLALYVVKEHAQRYAASHPKAVETISHSTLVDDVLDSDDSITSAKETLLQVRKIFAEAGMEMAKFHSNHPHILQALSPVQDGNSLLDLTEVCPEHAAADVKTLGLCYDTRSDHFVFKTFAPPPGSWTKRRVLKLFPRLYDPLGLLLPFSITARIYFSTVAKEEKRWDFPLPPSKEWEAWVQQLEQLPLLRFPRCLKTGLPVRTQLHLFADASKEAFAAAAYIVCFYTNQTPSARLVAARAHVAPKAGNTIPRLELRAADLAVLLKKHLTQHLKIQCKETFYWSDSITVLYWIKSDSKKFQDFVHNRLQHIRRASEQTDWRWVPTADNPADLATRGLSVKKLAASSLWKEGPAFLRTEDFPPPPKLIPDSNIISELKKAEQVVLTAVSQPQLCGLRDPAACSSLTRLYRPHLQLLHWLNRARVRLALPPLPHVHHRVEAFYLQQAQSELRKALSSSSPKTALRQLGFTALPPFLADDGLVRGRGRLQYALSIPRDMREPIMLLSNHPLTTLLLRHAHEHDQGHAGGTNSALNSFLSRFWTPRARSMMQKLVRQCVHCRRRLARPQRPVEAPLPALRLPGPDGPIAFAVTAVDCAGPYRVKRGRSFESYFMLLSTCCHTRAVRLEVLTDLSADSFLMALTRLAARGVNPSTVLSDNGTNFHAVNKLLKALNTTLAAAELERRKPKIKWLFNPPYASHYGGVFERLVGAAKSALYHALPSHFSLSLEQLYTAFAEVEGIMNTRPLAYVSTEEGDLTPLTPNHFLAGSASVPIVAAPWPVLEGHLLKRWEALQRAMESFRSRFLKEVVLHMREATNRRGGGRDLRVGDVVTFHLPTAHHKWPLALVNRTFPGKDGHVRTLELWRPEERENKLRRGGGTAQPIAGSSVNAPSSQPISAPSVDGGGELVGGGTLGAAAGGGGDGGREGPIRTGGLLYRRDAGAVALLLPVEETALMHI